MSEAGARLYFNPLIPLNSFSNITATDDLRRIKYGVISEKNAIHDLTEWENFALAGRLQKPVLPFVSESVDVKDAMNKNAQMALNLALFLNVHKTEVSLEELFTTIVGLSFHGDIRMQYKMENPNKIGNLVAGSMDSLTDLYLPKLLEMQAETNTFRFNDDGKIMPRHSNTVCQKLFDEIPDSLKTGLKRQII